MRNIKLVIEYDGKNYAGWQTQHKKQKTIQEILESTLRKILHHKIKVIGSGRTDAGVHALGQVANFQTHRQISPDRLKKGLNALLPEDIAVKDAKDVTANFHSRFAAKLKTYRYTILNRDHHSPLLRDKVYFCYFPLNLALMKSEARCLLGRHNFQAFQASAKKEKNPIKTIKKIKISKEEDLIYIEIEADGFLYNMVRSIVGTLIEIGRGRFKKGDLKRILLSQDRRQAGPTVVPGGLCLMRVKY